MKFLDSNVLAYAFYTNEYTEVCQNQLREGGLTNTFCLAEAFHIVQNETKSKEKAEIAIKNIMALNISIVDVDIQVIHDAIKRTKRYNFGIFDTIHYITALMNNCSSILSFDKKFNGSEIPREEP